MSKQDAPAALRTRPEWLTLGVASAVLGCVLTALVVLSIRVDRPATPTVTIAPGIHERDGRFFVQVEVHNDGDRAAADVQVLAELVGPEGTVSSEHKDLAGTNVLVNCIAPAVIETPLLAQMTEEHIRYMIEKIPMGRLGTIEEVAALVCWLASEECSFSTGATYDISGGRAVY